MTIATQVLDKLSKYTGDNEWDEVILHHDLDEEATEKLDPDAARSDVAIFKDGSGIAYREHEGQLLVKTYRGWSIFK